MKVYNYANSLAMNILLHSTPKGGEKGGKERRGREEEELVQFPAYSICDNILVSHYPSHR